VIKEVVDKNLLGFEIIGKTSNGCEIENITEPSREQFDNIFSKVLLNIEEIFVISEDMLKGKKGEFEDIERKIQQFDNFCRRVLSKGNHSDLHPLYWAFHSELIHAQRELYLMLRYLSKNKVKADEQDLDLLSDAHKIFGVLKNAYLKKSILLLEKIHEMEKELIYKNAYSILEKPKNNVPTYHIALATRKFYLANSPLMGILIAKGE